MGECVPQRSGFGNRLNGFVHSRIARTHMNVGANERASRPLQTTRQRPGVRQCSAALDQEPHPIARTVIASGNVEHYVYGDFLVLTAESLRRHFKWMAPMFAHASLGPELETALLVLLILWLIGAVLSFLNLCLIIGSDMSPGRRKIHSLIFLACVICASALFIPGGKHFQTPRDVPFWLAMLWIFGVPVIVIFQFVTLMTLRRRARAEKATQADLSSKH